MSEELNWLPARITFQDYKGDWFKYIEDLYLVYMRTLVWDRAKFERKSVLTTGNPMRDGKEETFWHIIEGRTGNKKATDFNRCACVPWIRPIIDACEIQDIKIWLSEHKSEKHKKRSRLNMALADFSYLIVLTPRPGRYYLVTAFPVEFPSQREKKRREYHAWVERTQK